MEAVIAHLQSNRDQYLEVVCAPDMVCAGCPNLTREKTCKNSGDHVREKDRKLADALGILPGGGYTYQQLTRIAQRRLTEQIFEESCRNCEWYAQGLCSYEKWRQSF